MNDLERLTTADYSTIFAALRLWQFATELRLGCNTGRIANIQARFAELYVGDHFADDKPLTPGQIDDLCRRLNFNEVIETLNAVEDRLNA